MDRTLYWDENQSRTFDYVQDSIDTLKAVSQLAGDLLGSTATVVSGLAATAAAPATLSISLAAGSIYQLADIDATTDGALAQNTAQILQQGIVGAQTITLQTTGMAAGQSQWQLIEAQFSQNDIVRPGDPNGGLLFFYNSANASSPFEGPGGDGATTPTMRQALVTVQVVTGAAATTGSEVPPTPSPGWTPLYLIDLSYGQTQITGAQIHAAAPSVGTGVPNTYPAAPFLAGLTNSHHGGVAGQAPKIKLGSEVQGTLPMANLLSSDTYGQVSAMQIYTGAASPNGNVAGNAASSSTPPSMCWATQTKCMFVCTATGTATTAVWTPVSPTGIYSWICGSPPGGVDLSLLPGQSANVSFSGVASVPLNIATQPGLYSVRLVFIYNNTTNSDIYLKANNTTYADAFSSYTIESDDQTQTTSPWVNAATSSTGSYKTQSSFYFDQFGGPSGNDLQNDIGPSISEYLVSTYTAAKIVKQSSAIMGGPAIGSAIWNDTTTAWTSLGTFIDNSATSLTGMACIQRLA